MTVAAAPSSTLSASLGGPGDVRLTRNDLAPPAAGQVLVKVAFTGICGSELHAIRDPEDLAATVARDGLRLGHEYSGVIAALGSGVTDLEPGDEVACRPRSPCGECQACRSGDAVHCEAFVRVREGAWTEAIVIPQQFASRIPAGTTLRQAALTEPLACALRAVDRSGLASGERVLVIGGGPMGLLVALLGLRAGAREVFVSEPIAYRRALVEALGAIPLDPAEGEVARQIRERTAGRGVEVAFEAAGFASTMEEAISTVVVGGRVVIVGVATSSDVANVRPLDIFARELTIVGAWGIETTFQRALDRVGSIGLDPIITHEYPLDELDAAVAMAAGGETGKVLLRPGWEPGDEQRRTLR